MYLAGDIKKKKEKKMKQTAKAFRLDAFRSMEICGITRKQTHKQREQARAS